MITRFAKIRDVKSPKREHFTDAGIDFFVPEYSEDLMNKISKSCKKGIPRTTSLVDEDELEHKYTGFQIRPHSNVLIPSGIKIEVLPGWMGMFADKSGIAFKKELIVGAKIVDTNYSGEVHLDIHNISDENVHIKFGQKMVQLIFVPVGTNPLMEVNESELYDFNKVNEKVRGEDGFGSTDNK